MNIYRSRIWISPSHLFENDPPDATMFFVAPSMFDAISIAQSLAIMYGYTTMNDNGFLENCSVQVTQFDMTAPKVFDKQLNEIRK